MFKEIEAFIRLKMIDELSYRLPELVIRPFSGFAQQCFEFGEHIFNRVQVGAVGRQIFDRRPSRFDEAVHDGRLQPGDPFENELALAARLNLSRPTVRRAMQEMVDQGLLVRP